MESDIDGKERGRARQCFCVVPCKISAWVWAIHPTIIRHRSCTKGSRFKEIICSSMIRLSSRSLQFQEDFFGLDATQFLAFISLKLRKTRYKIPHLEATSPTIL